MYAIFRAQGKQFRAEEGKTVRLPRMEVEPGSTITFDEVLLASDGDTISAGTPLVKGARVTAEVLDAEVLGVAGAPVAGGADALLVSHGITLP